MFSFVTALIKKNFFSRSFGFLINLTASDSDEDKMTILLFKKTHYRLGWISLL